MPHVRNLSFRQKIYRLSGTVVLCFLLLIGWLFNQYRTSLYQARKHEVRSLVDSEWQLLAYYAQQVEAGKLSQGQAKAQALETIGHLRFDKGNYFWIVDRTPKFLLEPLNPKLEGLTLSDKRIPGGASLSQGISTALKKSREGFISYRWPDRHGTIPAAKVSYIRLFPQWGWVIGAGYYQKDINRLLRGVVVSVTLIALAVVGIALFLVTFMTHYITSPMARAVEMIEALEKGDFSHRLRLDQTDEVGRMGKALDAFADNLQFEILTAFDLLSRGDFSFEAKGLIRQPLAKTNARLNKLVANLHAAIGREREEKSKTEAILSAIGDGVTIFDTQQRIIFQNAAQEALAGDRVGQYCFEACDHGGGHPSENTCPACAVKKTLADGQVHREGKRLAQSSLIFKTTAAPVKDAEGIILSVVEISRDVTEEKKTEERLRQSEQRYANLFQGNASVMLVFEQKTRQIVDANPAACLFYGYTKEQMTSMKITEINVLSREEISREIEEARAAGRRHFRFQHRLASGDIRDVEVFSGPVVVEGQSLIYALVYDVTERVLAEKKLQYLALHDVLTGLANRSLLEDRLSQALIRAQRHGETGGVFFLDLDHFKNINDSLGHQIGDLLLQQVAERLGRALRREDTISRLGGDEFILLLPGIKDGPEAALLAAEILHKLARSYQLPGKEVFITSSLGISLYPSDSLDFGTLIRNADTAMYHAKSEGRNNFQFFRSEMTTAVQQRLSLEHDLRRALTKDEFRLYYQPQVDAVTGEFVGVEALIRWLHPERGVVPPADFIPIAEENGLIDQIGAWVLRTACVQNRQWQSMGCQPIQIACNVSGRQFRNPNFIDTLDQILKESGCDPQRLEIEVTENILMENIEQSIATLVDLKTRKISLAIDDFGTGYSSLNYLRVFPIDRLKIDRSFVTRVTENVDDVAIANAIISLARTLKLDVVAEGVETAEQAALLRELGCDKFQGYFFGRPVPADALPPWAQIKDSDPTSSNPTI